MAGSRVVVSFFCNEMKLVDERQVCRLSTALATSVCVLRIRRIVEVSEGLRIQSNVIWLGKFTPAFRRCPVWLCSDFRHEEHRQCVYSGDGRLGESSGGFICVCMLETWAAIVLPADESLEWIIFGENFLSQLHNHCCITEQCKRTVSCWGNFSLSGCFSEVQYFSLMVSWLICAYVNIYVSYSLCAVIFLEFISSSLSLYPRSFLFLVFLCLFFRSLPLCLSVSTSGNRPAL